MTSAPDTDSVAAPPAPRRGSPSLVRAALRGVSWSLVGAVGQSVLQVVAIVVLSRLLSVEEFGVAVAASVVIGLAVMLGQLGIGPALVQARQLDRTDVATAFSLSTGLGVLLAGLLVLAAPLLDRAVGLPPGSPYLRILSLVLVLGGLSGVSVGLLQRGLRFRELAMVELVSYAVGYLGTAVVLAAAGAGAAALVWGQVVQAAILAVGSYALVRHDLRPPRLAVVADRGRRIVGFGSAYSLSQVGNWLALNGDNLVVTSTLGPASLGLYSRAYQLLVQPANLIGSVADRVLFPALSRIQDDTARMARAYVIVNSLVAVVTVPASVLLFVLAPEVVDVLLGPDWSAVALPLQVFAVVLLPRTAYKISGSLTRATGAVVGGAWRQWLYAGEVVVGCAVGSHWGVDGVAVGASVAIVLHCVTMLTFSARIRAGLVGRVLRAWAKSLPSGLAVAVVCAPLAAWLRPSAPSVVTCLVTALAGALVAGAVLVGTRRLFREELALVRPPRRT